MMNLDVLKSYSESTPGLRCGTCQLASCSTREKTWSRPETAPSMRDSRSPATHFSPGKIVEIAEP
eukprot:6274847-Prymnesium_polylepis.1